MDPRLFKSVHDWIREENYEMFRIAVDAGAYVDEFDHSGRKPIHYAAECRDSRFLQDLLNKGVNPNAPDRRPNGPFRPLWRAAYDGLATNVRILIEAGADIDCANNDMRSWYRTPTAIRAAIEKGHLDAVRVLIDKGAKFNDVEIRECLKMSYDARDDIFVALVRAQKGNHRVLDHFADCVHRYFLMTPKMREAFNAAYEEEDDGVYAPLLSPQEDDHAKA